MNGSIKIIFLLSFLSTSVILVNAQEITCTIKGKVVDRDSKNILLHKATEDGRIKNVLIPIVYKSFEYQLTVPVSEAYHLVFEDEHQKGMWHPILFFPEDGEINFTLHPMREHDKNKIEGGQLNQKLKDYNHAFNEDFESKLKPLYNRLNELRSNGEGESPKAEVIKKEIEAINKKAVAWKNKYIENNPSLISYFFFMKDLLKMSYTNDNIRYRYSQFSKQYPNHPYTELASNKIESLESIKVGGKFIDFSAPDLNGNIVKLSDVIKDKVALIDLWASWCGPCIKTSRAIIPVYEEFKDKGFTVIGVARESKNSEGMKRVLKREKYPWLNLIELDDQNEIWHKYNLSFSGGGTVLVNKKGKIIAIDPTSGELRTILQNELLE